MKETKILIEKNIVDAHKNSGKNEKFLSMQNFVRSKKFMLLTSILVEDTYKS